MVFSSMLFLWIFLPLVLVAYYVSPQKFRNGILIFFSLLFYAWGEPVYIFLMLFSVLLNFAGGIFIEKYPGKKKLILCGIVGINLLLLGYFKYFNFFSFSQVALPIGISFYTFQALSYVIDVYRGEVKAQHNFSHMLLYISFFPQLIAGPIVKYKEIENQIRNRKETLEKFSYGILRFVRGLGKKVLLANAFAKVVLMLPAVKPCGLGRFFICCRFIMIFPDIRIWLSDLEKCLGLIFRKISAIPILPHLCRISGEGGIFLFPPGSGIMFIFHLAETEKEHFVLTEIC